MDGENPTIRERLAVVETELVHVKNGLQDFKEVCDQEFKSIRICLTSYNKELGSLTSTIDGKLRGSLSGREKAAILISLITSIGAIIVAFLK